MVGVGGHQTLLNGKDQVVRGVKRRRRQGRIAPADAELQRVDRLTQTRGRFGLVLKPKHLDIVEQDI
jgi:hypothetical protein